MHVLFFNLSANTYCQARHGRGPCSVFCLPTESGYVCACEEGDTLNTDGRTCPGGKSKAQGTNSLPFNRILDYLELSVFADNKIDETQKLKFDLDTVINIVVNGENVGY